MEGIARLVHVADIRGTSHHPPGGAAANGTDVRGSVDSVRYRAGPRGHPVRKRFLPRAAKPAAQIRPHPTPSSSEDAASTSCSPLSGCGPRPAGLSYLSASASSLGVKGLCRKLTRLPSKVSTPLHPAG